MWYRATAVAALIFGIAGCSGSSGTVPPAAAASRMYSHIIVVIQENRSFDNVFAGAKIQGADVATSGLNSQNAQVPLHVQPYNSWGPDHAHASLVTEWK